VRNVKFILNYPLEIAHECNKNRRLQGVFCNFGRGKSKKIQVIVEVFFFGNKPREQMPQTEDSTQRMAK
jgi:hypothetical protein